MATTAAAKQALISGDWRETKDPQGKLYYFNRKLNKTVWDLDKELGASTSAATPSATTTTSAAAGASQPPTTGLPSTVSFETMAKDLVSKGVWSAKTSAVGGSAFFQHNETGETTRDLALYLEITSAVNSDKPRGSHFGGNSVTCADISGGGAPQELRSKNGTLLDRNELIGDVDPWVTLFLARDRGGEYEIASRKLLQQILERTGQWDSWNRAERRSEELQREVTAVKVQLKAKDETIAEQARELEDLRRMLYFGVQGLHMARKSVHELPKAPLPSAPRDIYTSLQDTNYSAAAADRIKELEGLVTSLQAKNRALVEELQSAQRGVHEAATCGPCAQLDPWRRLMEGTAGGTATSGSHGGGGAAVLHYPRPSGTPTSLLFLGDDQRREMHGVGVLPHSLRSPTTKQHPARGNGQAASSVTQEVGSRHKPSYPLLSAAMQQQQSPHYRSSPLRISPATVPNAILPLSAGLNIRR